MPAGLLGAGLLLCVERGQVNRKGIAGSRRGGGAALLGRDTNTTGGDYTEAQAYRVDRSIVTLLMGIISRSLQT